MKKYLKKVFISLSDNRGEMDFTPYKIAIMAVVGVLMAGLLFLLFNLMF